MSRPRDQEWLREAMEGAAGRQLVRTADRLLKRVGPSRHFLIAEAVGQTFQEGNALIAKSYLKTAQDATRRRLITASKIPLASPRKKV